MTSDPLHQPAEMPKRAGIRFSIGLAIASALLCIVLFLCYYFRYDACAAVTIFPPWGWLLPGMLPLGFGWRTRCYRTVCTVGFLWVGFLMCTAGELRSLGRGLIPMRHEAQSTGQTVRVVSLNCGEGGRLSIEETIAFQPDIILVQESPGPEQLREFARSAFGDDASVLYGSDTSIVVQGQILEVGKDGPARRNSVRARVRLLSGLEAEVISLRLEPCPVRLDLWSPDCWRQQKINRITRRNQLQRIIADL